jgi:beta-glucosidase
MSSDTTNRPACIFPEHFRFGSATAGHQVEGDNVHSQEWHDELHDERRKAGGKGRSGKACNHWELYRQDVDLIAELGHQAYRFSIEWSRIEPAAEQRDDAAYAHYRDLVERLVARKIQPWISVCHYTHPQWFEEKGGYGEEGNIAHFERHCEWMGRHFGDLAAGWVLHNEFNGGPAAAARRKINYLKAVARGGAALKPFSKAPTTYAHAAGYLEPLRKEDPFDRAAAAELDVLNNEWVLHAIRTGEIVHPGVDGEFCPWVRDAVDWWGLNYYRRHLVDARKANRHGAFPPYSARRVIQHIPPGDRKAEGLAVDEMFPDGLLAWLLRLRDRPLVITENGYVGDDDTERCRYIALHLAAVHEAIRLGVDARGYLYWSTMDNFEWGSFVPRFGLVHVDYATFQRTPKPSAFFYRDIIQAHGVTPEVAQRHFVGR